jgi:hypothetical protein
MIQVSAQTKLFVPNTSVALISAGFGDDKSSYLAKIKNLSQDSFQAYFHSSSLLYERVLTQGSQQVQVILGLHAYSGELAFDEAFKNSYALILKLYDEIKLEQSERLCPMT